jgi:hypothetical protein
VISRQMAEARELEKQRINEVFKKLILKFSFIEIGPSIYLSLHHFIAFVYVVSSNPRN